MRFPLAVDVRPSSPSAFTGAGGEHDHRGNTFNKGSEVATIPAGTSVRDAVALLKDRKIGAVPVVDGDRIVGIFSERDLVCCICAHGAEVLDWPSSG